MKTGKSVLYLTLSRLRTNCLGYHRFIRPYLNKLKADLQKVVKWLQNASLRINEDFLKKKAKLWVQSSVGILTLTLTLFAVLKQINLDYFQNKSNLNLFLK